MTDLAHLAARVFNTPLLLHPRKAEVIASVLAARMSDVLPLTDVDADRGPRSFGLDRIDGEPRGPVVTNRYGDRMMQERYRFREGVALVTVEGSLVNRGAWVGASSGLMSYEGITAQLNSAAADADVDNIIVSFDCPGGEAAGAFEMADTIRQVAAQKPVIALVDAMAASAAYAMASAATRIVTLPSGVSGSIGVVMLHLDRSQQMAKAGIKPTLIFSGDHKVDGNPFEALPPDVAAEFKAECDALRAMFVATVAKGRPNLDAAAIHATQARCFIGADAVAAGLADEVGTLESVFSALKQARAAPGFRGATRMTDITRADHEKGLTAARAEGFGAGIAAGQATFDAAGAQLKAEGAKAERERIAAIFGLEEAKGREASAQHMALATSMSADEVKGILAGLPQAAAPAAAAAGPVPGARMANTPNPPVKADGSTQEPPSSDAMWEGIVARGNAERGFTKR